MSDVSSIDFLRLVCGAGVDGGWIEIRAIPEPKAEHVYTQTSFFETPEAAHEWLWSKGKKLNRKSHGLFFGVARRARRPEGWHGGRNEDVDSARCLWADLDWKGYVGGKDEAVDRLQSCCPAPTIIVCSGGGYHAYWCLRDPISATLVRALNQRLVLTLQSDKTVVNPGRVLRCPGAMHRKNPDKIRPVSVVGWRPSLMYDECAFNSLPKLPPAAKRLSTSSGFRLPSGAIRRGSPASRYAHAALLSTCERLASAPDGKKHRELFLAAISLGRFVGVGLLFGADVSEWLLSAIARAGAKDLRNAEKTIHDGLMRGIRETPNMPEDLLK